MNLKSVIIRNFLSIKEETLTFEQSCRILVGINESGKSNVLCALAYLDRDKDIEIEDQRQPTDDEEEITESAIKFGFTFDADDHAEVYAAAKEEFLTRQDNPLILERTDGKKITLKTFCNLFTGGIHNVDLIEEERAYLHYVIRKSDFKRILEKWKKVKDTCPADLKIDIDGVQKNLKDYKFVNIEEFKELPVEQLEVPQIDSLAQLFGAEVINYIEDEMDFPTILLWEYKETNLLPSRIPLAGFIEKPDSCRPLKSMFELRGIAEDDIASTLNAEKAKGETRLDNFLKRVAAATSDHFHECWKDYENIKFHLRMNGESIVAEVEDVSNKFPLDKRSDGFKRFVTFLLLVSAKAKSGNLTNTLLLIDEPEIGLHPDGCKYLLEELIKISKKNNIVVFSTHSIFMIDEKKIQRHIIVKKRKEVTKLTQVDESNVTDEEVVYAGLNYSVFRNLKAKNILFEGWKDKRLFDVAMTKIPTTHKKLNELKTIGKCHANGAKDVDRIVPMFQAGTRGCVILTDADPMAIEYQKKHQKGKMYGDWITLKDAGSPAITGEDFIEASTFASIISSKICPKYSIDVPLTAAELEKAKGKLAAIKGWMTKSGMQPDEVSTEVENLKDEVFSNLKNSQVRADYYDYILSATKGI
ncbi:MAG: hypothetical protein A2756_05440 [Candidatus Ryanbacteria bacterium RIFCSPHIGHO2_01_FULL_48_27]|uniref:Endonuclease GajA/Old nuclease/RecF-like AAA domain-containing protein n=1 Tax=Candidatus Ryanbacteria bacterium RIFCSPHIGHO2_01_FULL_48_27 TaxID=1802115 RepID=A0A1G2G4B4_9BACT|nr:MAG: hypothetical protein A2756_05440 [Candidatus Ryanbacteria bacterium RIFCSPHIGHO2_01_FULL_48_27]